MTVLVSWTSIRVTGGDDPGAGVEPDTFVAHVRGEHLAQTLDRARRVSGVQPLRVRSATVEKPRTQSRAAATSGP